jgi:exopolysaccharide/PEP-CTERM locus tyrosine autokinase
MSIVEKALQKAQQAPGAQPPPSGRAAEPPSGPPATGVPEQQWAAPDTPRAEQPVRPATVSRQAPQRVVVDPARLRQFGLLPAEDLVAEALDEFRRIKWPLLESALGRAGGGTVAAENNLILITSAVAEEGKSFTALSLAGAIGRERDCRAILVDADLSRPKLTEALGLQDRKGLHDLLADESMTVGDVLYQTDIEGLFFVPAGTHGESGPELLASRRMAQVCADLSQWAHDGVVLFDSSPLLLSNESQVISRLVGQVLLVVRADFTEQRMVREAVGLLDRTKLISTVLNNVQRTGIGDDPMTYGYGYGYGSRKRYGSPGSGGSR